MSDNKNTSGGIGFTSLLLVAFIVLKLCNVINWSWWWVLSPAWISAAIAILIIVTMLVYYYFKERNLNKRIVNKQGELKSKWQQRLDEIQQAHMKAEELKAQRNA